MLRVYSRTAGIAAAALLSLLTPQLSQAVSYFPAWGQLYNHTSTVSQFPHAVALDSRGNVFVTGHQIVGSAKGFYTAKYDALDGHLIWQKELNGAGTNEFIANDIAVDSQGDCVVTGSRNAGGIDYYTVKYSGVDGGLVWQKSFNGANDGEDTALKVVCDGADNAIVTGRSVGNNGSNSTSFDFVTIKYRSNDGLALAMDSYTQTSGNLEDVPAALAVDSQNNVYVGGTVRTAPNQLRFYLRKLKAADLTKLWDIVPINTGDEGGITAMAVDSSNAVVATGTFKDVGNHFGYFTAKYDSAGQLVWKTNNPPVSTDTFGSPRPGPTAIAIGPDNAPVVTGKLLNGGNYVIRTVKYTSGGFFQGETEFWQEPSVDNGLGFGDTGARAAFADGTSNTILVGESENQDGNTDLYIAKYDALTGKKVFSTAFTGSFTSSADIGVDVAGDQFGNIVALGEFVADKGTGIGLSEFGTVKLNRLIAPTAEELPDNITGVPEGATIKVAGAPAIGTTGTLAARLTFKAGKKSGNALLVEGSPTGGSILPAVQGQPAPVGVGESAANWVSFSDPIVAPNGTYAFAAKVSGPGSKANGVWGNLNGTLKSILRQGSVIPVVGSTDKFASLTNMDLVSNNLVALVKLDGPAATKTALLRIDQNNSGSILLRTGESGFMINGEDYTVKGITVFSPPRFEAGDGRWQGSSGVVAQVSAVKTSDPKSKASAIVSITNAGAKTVLFSTGQTAAAPIDNATYSAFGFPATAFGTLRFATKATITPRPASGNSALIYSSTGAAFNAFAQKGEPTSVQGLPSGVSYADFTDPIVNTNSLVAFIATLKGSKSDVKSGSNKAIVFGDPLSVLERVARTGDDATDTAGAPTSLKWTAFTALALPGSSGPIFVGKLNTKKNNVGLWALDAAGKVRLLLRTGDQLGDQTVKKFTLLTAVSKATSAGRSFDSAGSVAVALNFTDGTTALMRIGIP